MDMSSLLAYMGQSGTSLTATQQQQLLASLSSSYQQHAQQQQVQVQQVQKQQKQTQREQDLDLLLQHAQQQQVQKQQKQTQRQQEQNLSSLGLTAAQQQLLSAAGTSLTSLGSASAGRYDDRGSFGEPSRSERRTSNSSLASLQQQSERRTSNSSTSLASMQQPKPPRQQQQPLYSQQESRSSTPSATNGSPSSTPIPSPSTTPRPAPSATPTNGALDPASQTKYQQLLLVIEEMKKDLRPCYAGSKSSAERLKRGIVYTRILVRECLVEAERSNRN